MTLDGTVLTSVFGPARRPGDGLVCISAFGPLSDTRIAIIVAVGSLLVGDAQILALGVKVPPVVVGRDDATPDDTTARSDLFFGPEQLRERPECSSTAAKIPELTPKPIAGAPEDARGSVI